MLCIFFVTKVNLIDLSFVGRSEPSSLQAPRSDRAGLDAHVEVVRAMVDLLLAGSIRRQEHRIRDLERHSDVATDRNVHALEVNQILDGEGVCVGLANL